MFFAFPLAFSSEVPTASTSNSLPKVHHFYYLDVSHPRVAFHCCLPLRHIIVSTSTFQCFLPFLRRIFFAGFKCIGTILLALDTPTYHVFYLSLGIFSSQVSNALAQYSLPQIHSHSFIAHISSRATQRTSHGNCIVIRFGRHKHGIHHESRVCPHNQHCHRELPSSYSLFLHQTNLPEYVPEE